MNSSDSFYANRIYNYSKNRVEQKTILLIESYEGRTQGDVSAVLLQVLADERFSDWKIRWVFPDAAYMPEDFSREKADRQIELVCRNSLNFLQALEQSQVIISGSLLPSYYVKNEGQVVVGIFPAHVYLPEPSVSKKRVMIQQSLSKLDILYCDNEMALEAVAKWYPSGTPFLTLNGSSLRNGLDKKTDADVIVSLTDKGIGKIYADLEQKFKEIKLICSEYKKTLHFRIPQARWEMYTEENQPEVLDYVGSDLHPFCTVAQNAQVVVTNRREDMRETLHMGKYCIFITNQVNEYYDIYQENQSRMALVGSWKEAKERLTIFVSGNVSNEKNILDGQAVTAARELLEKVLYSAGAGCGTAKSDRDDELFIFPSDIHREIWNALEFYNPHSRLSVLVRSSDKEKLWKKKYSLDERIHLFTKLGKCASEEDGSHSPAILSNEWNRLLGEKRFGRIYAFADTEELWQKLYECAPGEMVSMVSYSEILDILLSGLDNPALRNEEAEFERTCIDGVEYYKLGEHDSEQFFVKCRGEIVNPVLVFINGKGDCRLVRDFIGGQECRKTFFVIDPQKHMKKMKILKEENVYWIPVNILPVKLFLCAQAVVLCNDMTVRKVSEYLGKRLIDLKGINIRNKLSESCRLLAIHSEKEIIWK